jgi:restriction endonuclease S subunit
MSGNGNVPFYNASANNPIGFHHQASFESDLTYFVFNKDGGSQHNIDSDNVGLGKFFRMTGKVAITSHSLICIPKNQSIVYINYLDAYLKMKAKEIRQLARYTTGLGTINRDRLATFQIQIPSEEIMQQISDKYIRYTQFLETNKDYVDMLDESIRDIYPTYLNMSNQEIRTAIDDHNRRIDEAAAAAAAGAEEYECPDQEGPDLEDDDQYERKADA